MAFTPGIGQTLYTRVLGMVRQAGNLFDPIATAQALYAQRGPLTNNFLDFLNMTRSAQRAWQAGVRLRGLAGQRLRTREHPIDPTLAGSADRFRYRVVVHDGQAQGSSSYETVVLVDSPTPLSADDVIAQAIARAQARRGTQDETPRARTLHDPSQWVGTIVSAGRRD